MQVAVDARWMQPGREGGIGRGIANLLPHLTPHVEVHLLTDARLPPAVAGPPEHPLRAPWPANATVWLQWSAPRWLRSFDGAFHCPFYGLPYRQPVPMVVTIHDLTFEHHRAWFSRAAGAAFRVQARHAARSAAAVLTVSQHVREDIVGTYDVEPDRVLVAPNAVDPVFSPDRDAARTLDRLGVTAPYVVALGGAPRRNSGLAVAAWRHYRERGGDAGLVVVGARDLPDEPRLAGVGRLADPQWADLLAGAEAFLYPTGYEGFGMPALESAASGTPVLCARVGALPEVLDDAAAWVEDLSRGELGPALAGLLSDPSRAAELRERGLRRAAAAPGWEHSAEVHLEAYRRAGNQAIRTTTP